MLPYPAKLPFEWERKIELAVSFEEKLIQGILYKGLTRMGEEDHMLVVMSDKEDPVDPFPYPLRASGLGNCARLLWFLRYAPQDVPPPSRPPVPKSLVARQSGKMYEEYLRCVFALGG